MTRRVTLLTDFGTSDGFVGAMKGVIASETSDALIDDISHDIPPGDVVSAAYALARYWDLYPGGTVHVVVVDPGVGTARRPLAFQVDGRFVVCPDNGCVSRVLDRAEGWRAVDVSRVTTPSSVRSGRSHTFHGRDVFAPAAARLVRGVALHDLGSEVGDPVRIEEPIPVRQIGGGRGVVVAVDRFGNLLTNIPGEWVGAAARVEIADRTARVARTYGDAEEGELVALTSSDGRIEVAVRGGSAAALLGLGRGAAVEAG